MKFKVGYSEPYRVKDNEGRYEKLSDFILEITTLEELITFLKSDSVGGNSIIISDYGDLEIEVYNGYRE